MIQLLLALSLSAHASSSAPTKVSPADVTIEKTVHSETKTVIEPSGETTETQETETTTELKLSQGAKREVSSVAFLFHYSPLDLLIPSKIGATVAFNVDRTHTYELTYLQGSVSAPFFITDIGGFTDRRVEGNLRFYHPQTSFNAYVGIAYFNTDIHVGSDLLKSAANLPTFDILKSQMLGVTGGIGNRWILPYHITVGLDWIQWSQPLIILQEDTSIINSIQDQTAKHTVETAFHLSEFIPRFVVAKLGIGVTF